MSADIFLWCCRDGKSEPFGRKVMDEVFGFRDSINDRDPGSLRIYYPDGGGAEIHAENDIDAGNEEEITHIGSAHSEAIL